MKPLSTVFFLALAACLAGAPASAQLMLPGALQAGPSTAQPPSAGPSGPAKPKPAPLKPPGEETIVDRELLRNGRDGLVSFQRSAAKGLEIKALSMTGEEISRRGEACRIDVVSGDAIEAKPLGRANGLLRFGVEIAACPFTFDVLDGAVLIRREGGACAFAAADCRVDPTGVWGPNGTGFDEKQIKAFEKARGQAETVMRANFRALLSSAGKDKEAVKRIAADQAGFSSERETVCRTYEKEDSHAFCALKMTQARGFTLAAAYEESAKAHPEARKARRPEARKAAAAPAQ